VVITKRATIAQIAELVREKVAAIERSVAITARSDYLRYRDNALFFAQAGALVIVLMKPVSGDAKGHFWGVPGFFANEARARGDIMAIGAACQNILLAAESLGLVTCLMHYPLVANDSVRALLNIVSPWEVMAYIPVGIRTEPSPEAPGRRSSTKVSEFIVEET